MTTRSAAALSEWSMKHGIFLADDVGFEFSRASRRPTIEDARLEAENEVQGGSRRNPSTPDTAQIGDSQGRDGGEKDGEEFESRLVALTDLAYPSHSSSPKVLIRVPRATILAEDTLASKAASEPAFGRLLKKAETTREKIITCLATLLIHSRDMATESVPSLAHWPWLEYVRLLPVEVPVPTTWSDEDRKLLVGTSLEAAIDAKLQALDDEFEQIVYNASDGQALYGEGTMRLLTKKDWIVVDAWYRSRTLEIPGSGTAMVPIIDMINHSAKPTAYYDTTEEGDVVLLLKADAKVRQGDEITISYGRDKSPAEMLFSYGFVDRAANAVSLVLPIFPEDDDPLAPLKASVYCGLPVITISRDEAGVVSWRCPFAWLSCVNEEDGLKFAAQRLQDDSMKLALFWQGENQTDRVMSFREILSLHEAFPVFELRVLQILKGATQEFLNKRLDLVESRGQANPKSQRSYISAALFLQTVEFKLLTDMVKLVHDQLTALTQDEELMARVMTYLGKKERADNGEV